MKKETFKKILLDLRVPVYSIIMLLLLSKYPVYAWILFYIPIIYYLFLKQNAIDHIKKKWLPILLSTGVFFYIGRVIAEKKLNSQFEIMTEYLNHSSTILGAIYATLYFMLCILLFYCIVLCFVFFKNSGVLLLKDIIDILEKIFKFNHISQTNFGKIAQKYEAKGLFMPWMSWFGGMLVVTFLFSSTEKITPYILLSDAYEYSACNTIGKEKQTLYIRKTQNQCYKVESSPKLRLTIIELNQ